MKKVILVLAFVFASSNLVNANNSIVIKKDCFEYACLMVASAEEHIELDEEGADAVFEMAYEDCQK